MNDRRSRLCRSPLIHHACFFFRICSSQISQQKTDCSQSKTCLKVNEILLYKVTNNLIFLTYSTDNKRELSKLELTVKHSLNWLLIWRHLCYGMTQKVPATMKGNNTNRQGNLQMTLQMALID